MHRNNSDISSKFVDNLRSFADFTRKMSIDEVHWTLLESFIAYWSICFHTRKLSEITVCYPVEEMGWNVNFTKTKHFIFKTFCQKQIIKIHVINRILTREESDFRLYLMKFCSSNNGCQEKKPKKTLRLGLS